MQPSKTNCHDFIECKCTHISRDLKHSIPDTIKAIKIISVRNAKKEYKNHSYKACILKCMFDSILTYILPRNTQYRVTKTMCVFVIEFNDIKAGPLYEILTKNSLTPLRIMKDELKNMHEQELPTSTDSVIKTQPDVDISGKIRKMGAIEFAEFILLYPINDHKHLTMTHIHTKLTFEALSQYDINLLLRILFKMIALSRYPGLESCMEIMDMILYVIEHNFELGIKKHHVFMIIGLLVKQRHCIRLMSAIKYHGFWINFNTWQATSIIKWAMYELPYENGEFAGLVQMAIRSTRISIQDFKVIVGVVKGIVNRKNNQNSNEKSDKSGTDLLAKAKFIDEIFTSILYNKNIQTTEIHHMHLSILERIKTSPSRSAELIGLSLSTNNIENIYH